MSCIRYIRSYIIDFLCMQFSRYIQIRISKTLRASHLLLTDCLSVIRTQNFFWTLITGKPSVNSTALLIGSALKDCCPSLPVFMPKDFARSFRALVGWYFRILGEVLSSLRFLKFPYPKQRLYFFLNLAATYSPTPSPVQYHRPSGS